jgi:isoleucyl-tRNA synthetase
MDYCKTGDPLCYYIIYDSKVICGTLPEVSFNFTNETCEKLKLYAISNFTLSMQGMLRNDEISSLENSYKSIRNLVRWLSCINKKKIPLRNSEILNEAKEIDEELLQIFKDLVHMRKNKIKITLYQINIISELLSKYTKIEFPKIRI